LNQRLFITRKILVVITFFVICNIFLSEIREGFSFENSNFDTMDIDEILQEPGSENLHYLFGKTTTWFESFEIEGTSIVFDEQGNSYFTGTILTDFIGNSDIIIGKLNSTGTIEWIAIYDYNTTDMAYDLCFNEATDLLYIIGSTANISRASYTDFLIGCYDATSGLEIWNNTFGIENYHEIGYSIEIFENKLYIAGIGTEYIDFNSNIILACFDSLTGYDIWVKNYNSEIYEYAPKLILDSNTEEIYFVFNSKIDQNETQYNQYSIQKLTLEGNQIWEINSSLEDNIILNDFSIETTNNLLVIVGEILNSEISTFKDTVIISYNLTGNEKARITYGSVESNEVGLTIAIVESEKIIIAGYSTSDFFNHDVAFMTKFDSTGKVIWSGKNEKHLRSRVNSLAVNNAGFIVTAGFAEGKYDYIFQRLFIGLTIDEDDDNLSNFWEEEIGTNPTLFDTDQDGFSDGQEFLHNTDPLDKFSNTNNRRIMFGFSIAFTLLIIIIFLIINFFAKNKSSEETTTIVKIYDKITSKLKRKKEQNVID